MHIRVATGIVVVLGLLGSPRPVQAALMVTPIVPTLDAEALATLLLGPMSGITLNDATYVGAPEAAGTFAGGLSIVGVSSGVLLTTGSVFVAPGPNDDPLATVDNFAAGDPLLDALAGTTTADVAALRIAFTPTADTITLRYVFASEEYPVVDFITMNDAFGAFVNGSNAALLPGTGQPVTVFNVNSTTNAAFFIDNSSGARDLQYDGLTTVLTLSAPVLPGQVNLLELLIGDAGDGIGDSGVFLEEGSLNSCTAGTPDCGGGGTVPEPGLFLLLAGGIAGWGSRRARRRS